VDDAPRQALWDIAAEAVAHDAKLVAPEPRHRAPFSKPRETLGDDPEHLVAEPVAVDVVDRLEIVEVDDEQRASLACRQLARPFVEILDEPAAVGKAGEHVVAGELIRLGLGLPPAHDFVAQVDCAANRVNLGGDAEENEKDHQPVDRVALRLVGEFEERVEGVVPDGQ
jgi:hypothetical protein